LAGVPPQNPLGELTALPQTPKLDLRMHSLRLREGRERRTGGKGKGGGEARGGGYLLLTRGEGRVSPQT